MKWSSFRILVAVTILIFAGAGGAGYAHFSATGGASGHFDTGTLQPVTVAAFVGGDAPSSALLPGGSADVILRVSNPNSYNVTLVSVTVNGIITADPAHSGCAPTGVTFTDQTGLTINIPAGSSLVHMAGNAQMAITSPNACQGATFSIPVTITVIK